MAPLVPTLRNLETSLSGQLADKMDIPGLTGSESKEYAIDVLVTFKGNDGNSYTIGGSCYM